MTQRVNDLVVLVADKNMEFAVKGILENHRKLGIHPLPEERRKILQAQQDAGCFRRCDDLLRPFSKDFNYALVMLDREGSGKETLSREQMEADIENRLAISGWDDRAVAIVFDPELEMWVWSDSPQVDEVLGWGTRMPSLRTWLIEKAWLQSGEIKPVRPKEALEDVLRQVRRARSSAIYLELAQKVSFQKCTDPAFLKMKRYLQDWFPKE
jgi:hypothetical protein